MSKYLSIYKILIKQNIKAKLAFPIDFLISTIAILFTNFIGLITFFIIFNNVSQIEGFNYYEMLFIYSFFIIAISPQQIFFDNIWNIWSHFINGTFIKYYLRPIDSMFYYISETIDLKGIAQFILGIIIFFYSLGNLDYSINLQFVVTIIIMVVSSSIILISLMIIAASTGFWILDPFEIISLTFKIKDFAKYPMAIYNKFLKFIFSFIIPIGFLAYFPSSMIIEKSVTLGIITPAISIIIVCFARWLWKKGMGVYNATGS